MSADYTTTGLIRNAKRRGFIPTGSGLTTSELLEVLSEQLRNYIPAFLKGLREEYLVASLNIAVTSATVPAPQRAVGAAFRTIGWVRGDGTVDPLSRIEPERRRDYPLTASEPAGYMFQGNNLLLVPGVTSGTVVVTYQQRPGQLVLPTDCAKVTAITEGFTGVITEASARALPYDGGSGPLNSATSIVGDNSGATGTRAVTGLSESAGTMFLTSVTGAFDAVEQLIGGDWDGDSTATDFPAIFVAAPATGFEVGRIVVGDTSEAVGTISVRYVDPGGVFVALGLTSVAGTFQAEPVTINALVTVEAKPADFLDATLYDFVSHVPNFEATALDASGLSWASLVATMSPALAALLAVGDYLCAAEETCIPQIPLEIHDLLAQAGACQVASDTGSTRLGAIRDALKELRDQLTIILSPRNDGSSRPIVNRSNLGRRF